MSRSPDNGSPKLYFLLPLRCIIFPLIFIIGSAVTGRELESIMNWWSVAACLVNILTIALIFLLLKRERRGFRELLHLKKEKRSVGNTLLAALVLSMAGMGGMYLSGLIFYGSVMPEMSLRITSPLPVALAAAVMLLLPATISLAEDGLYLGCGTGCIKNRYAAVAVPAFFYALQHCFIPTLFDARYILYRFLSFLPLTVVFCIWFSKKKDTLPIIISHTLLDTATASMILMMSLSPATFDKWLSMV